MAGGKIKNDTESKSFVVFKMFRKCVVEVENFILRILLKIDHPNTHTRSIISISLECTWTILESKRELWIMGYGVSSQNLETNLFEKW